MSQAEGARKKTMTSDLFLLFQNINPNNPSERSNDAISKVMLLLSHNHLHLSVHTLDLYSRSVQFRWEVCEWKILKVYLSARLQQFSR